jgi:hypothetical protein
MRPGPQGDFIKLALEGYTGAEENILTEQG